MSWEQELFALFDDLESHAAAAFEAEREAEVRDRARTEYAGVELASRLVASVGCELQIRVRATGWITGTVDRAGTDWCLLRARGTDWLVPTHAVLAVRGASPRAVPPVARAAHERLGLGSALRRLADAGEWVIAHLDDASSDEVTVERVGADFLEARTRGGDSLLIAFAALAAVQSR